MNKCISGDKNSQPLNVCIVTMFVYVVKCCINWCEWYINKPLSKNLQNIERNKTVKFGVCKCSWSGDKNSQPLNICIFTMFLGVKCCINQCEWYINKPLSKNLQNIERNKTVKFGVCKCSWSGDKNSQPLIICIFTMFLGVKCCINQCEWNINKPLSKNHQNIERNKALKFGVCKCIWSGEKTL